jgi:hypothetical protein
LGYLDDLVIVPLGIWAVVKMIPADVMAEHRATALAELDKPVSATAGVLIVVVWIALSALAAWPVVSYSLTLIASQLRRL